MCCILWFVLALFAFLEVRKLNKYCLWTVNHWTIFSFVIFSLVNDLMCRKYLSDILMQISKAYSLWVTPRYTTTQFKLFFSIGISKIVLHEMARSLLKNCLSSETKHLIKHYVLLRFYYFLFIRVLFTID